LTTAAVVIVVAPSWYAWHRSGTGTGRS
jgi:hypothetical protein